MQFRFWLARLLVRLARRLVEPSPGEAFDPRRSRVIDAAVDLEDRSLR
jgi:hypothetical protein